tara:strand:- start:4624 stop:5880 length:1257 start_codon:yes stop_codon:yes gene_type:complete
MRWAMASQVVTSGANFATTLIIVRSLGLGEFGQFSVCFLLAMIMRNFLNGVLLTPMSTIAPKLTHRAQANYRGFLAVNGIAFSLSSSILLYALAAPLGIALNAPWLPEMALALALANFTANGADFIRRYHFVQNAPVWAFAVDMVRFTVQLGLLLALALVWNNDFSAQTALYALAAGGLFGLIGGLLHYGTATWSNRVSSAVWPRHWNFIKWMTPNVTLEVAQNSGVLLLGGAILGDAALGGVRAMQNLANTINLPFNALQQVAPTLASRALVAGGVVGMKRFIASMIRWSLLLVFLITFAVFVFADPLIAGLFQIPVSENLGILLLFCGANALVAIRFPLTVGFQSTEQPLMLLMANTLAAVVAAAGVIWLSPILAGAAIPTTRILAAGSAIIFLAILIRNGFSANIGKGNTKPLTD